MRALALVFLVAQLSVATAHSHLRLVRCCSQTKSNAGNFLLHDVGADQKASSARENRPSRHAGRIVGIVASAQNWGTIAEKKIEGFLNQLDKNIDNDSFAFILGAWSVATSGRHWGIGYSTYCYAVKVQACERQTWFGPSRNFDKMDCVLGACFASVVTTLCGPIKFNHFAFKALYFVLQGAIAADFSRHMVSIR